MADNGVWSQLPKDLLSTISKRLNNGVDNLRLRSVCSSWRSSIPLSTQIPPLPLQLPFPFSPHPSLLPNRRGHFSLSQSTIYFLQSNPKQNTPASPPWLIRVHQTLNHKLHPVNPLSKIMAANVPKTFPKQINLLNFQITELGKAYTLEFVDRSKKKMEMDWEERRLILIKKVVVSSNPWTSDGVDYAVIAINKGKLWFIKFGDEKWSAVHDPKNSKYDDCVYHKGRFYAVDYKGRVVVIGADLRAEEIVASFGGRGGGHSKQLVESCGELFLIDKHLDEGIGMYYDEDVGDTVLEVGDPERPLHLEVYKLNEEKNEWEWVESLGDRVFFVGDDCSFWVSTKDFSGLKRDCIYFCDDTFVDYNEEKNLADICGDTGIYSLEDGSCGALASFPGHSKIFWPPPAWIKPKPRATKK